MPEYKILQGGRINNTDSVLPTQQNIPRDDSQLGALGRTLFAGLKGVEDIHPLSYKREEIPGAPWYLQPPKSSKLSSVLLGELGVSPEQDLGPQSGVEGYAHKLARFGPASLALGGLPALATTAVGAIPSSILQQLGASEGIQDIAQLGTELGVGFLPQKVVQKLPEWAQKSFGKLPTISKAVRESQEKLKGTAVKNYVAEPIISTMDNIVENLGTEVVGVQDKVNEALKIVSDHIFKGKMNPQKAVRIRRSIDKIYRQLPKESAAEYIQPLRNSIQDFFSLYSAENPQFYKNLKSRDKLTQLKHMQTIIDKSAPLLDIPVFGGLSKMAKSFYSKVIGSTVGETERFLRGIAGNSEARKHYFNLAQAAGKNDPALFAKSIINLKSTLEPEEEKESISKKYKIIQGGKLS